MRMEGLSLDESSSHGFSMQLIEDITNSETIFTVQDLTFNFPVFSVSNFGSNSRNIHGHSKLRGDFKFSRVHEWFDFDGIDFGVENE